MPNSAIADVIGACQRDTLAGVNLAARRNCSGVIIKKHHPVKDGASMIKTEFFKAGTVFVTL